MARGKGTANLAASIEPLAGAPLDARDIVPTVADLYVAANWPYKYIGMKTTVTATGETYRLVNMDVTQESSWVLDGASGQTIQVNVMPTAGESELGKVYQYIGATDSSFTHGYFYECVLDDSTYSWEEVKTSSLPTIGVGGGYAPIGTIISYMGTTAPQDYLICDGTTYNIADYKQLSDFFAAQFGSANFFGGDGVTTFKVPDLRGEFLRGTGTNSHTNQGNGENVGVHQDSTEIPNVYAWVASGGSQASLGIELKNKTGSQFGNKAEKVDSNFSNEVGCITQENVNITERTSSNASYTSRPTNTSVLYCIKAVVAGDVYSTTERVVGTWIDGKPVYEKTVVFENQTLSNSTRLTLANNVDILVASNIIDKRIENNLKQITPHNFQSNNLSSYDTYFRGGYYEDLNGNNNVLIYHVQVGSNHPSDRLFDLYFTVRYTKTTD